MRVVTFNSSASMYPLPSVSYSLQICNNYRMAHVVDAIKLGTDDDL